MGTDKEAKYSFLSKYRNRKDHLDMNMDDYFNYYYNGRYHDKNRKKYVPYYTGGRIECSYPTTTKNARSVLTVYKPWNGDNPYTDNMPEREIMQHYKEFMKDLAAVKYDCETSKLNSGELIMEALLPMPMIKITQHNAMPINTVPTAFT